MGLKDRPYWRDQQPSQFGGSGGPMGGMRIGLPKPTGVVKYFLIANIAVFLGQIFTQGLGGIDLAAYFGVTARAWWQPWRYLTFQFLHSTGSLWHLGLNMLGLYMLGTPLSRQWGAKRFATFYLTCGATAGVAYVIMAMLLLPSLAQGIPLIGASGGVYGIVLACAVLFPQFQLIFFLFPVPIRLAAVVIFGGMILLVLSSLSTGQTGPRFWSDVAHLGGAVAAAVWVWAGPGLGRRLRQQRARLNQGAWQRKIRKYQAEQEEIDRILDKIRREGIGSLSGSERDKLRNATKKQNRDEQSIYRT